MTDSILFEHPLNEKCRTLLRLSNLFEQLDFHLQRDNEWDSRAAVRPLLEIAAILARADIKSDLIKELDRHSHALAGMANSPGVDRERLEHVLADISYWSTALKSASGQLGEALRNNDFLNSISQRSGIPGGCFEFDLPQFHYWLQLPHQERALQLDSWRTGVDMVEQATNLLLTLIRNSQVPVQAVAENGIYHQNLDTGSSSQMVRVRIASDAMLFAEVSGSKHRFSIRFLETGSWEQPNQTTQTVPFQLTTCVI